MNLLINPSKEFMKAAIEEALKAKSKGGYSIGAVVIDENGIVSRAWDRTKHDEDPAGHAELVAIREACKSAGSRFLPDCVLYTTHEPCPMCASAAVWARLKGIVFGSSLQDMIDYRKANATEDWTWRTIDVSAEDILGKGEPKLFLVKNFMRDECKRLFHT